MASRTPITELSTHSVTNQAPALENYNLFTSDIPLQEAVTREASTALNKPLSDFGETLGTE